MARNLAAPPGSIAMSLGGSRSHGWPPGRWWSIVVLIFIVQVGIIAWLGQRSPPSPRAAVPAPRLQLAGQRSAELVALTDPTLFVLPHWEGFAGEAWLQPTNWPYKAFVWSEPTTNWLRPPTQQLGLVFEQFLQTNVFPALPLTPRLEPELAFSPPAPAAEPAQSTLRLAGELAHRQLLAPLELPSWPSADLLTNSVVQVVLGTQGRPVSFTLLVSSGLKEADQHALAQARTARFEPLPGPELASGDSPLNGLSWGELVFEWHTLPLPEPKP